MHWVYHVVKTNNEEDSARQSQDTEETTWGQSTHVLKGKKDKTLKDNEENS